ncbi:hypothetical protein HN51_008105 [Arachis hypogaea]|uniref:Isoflavone 7-O-methyltransferase n=2 Tax=Arachis TaxID=3817 RepID=A0A445D4T0_ARAHY|nr:isoflavone-7-O-methyltransferase 9 [Arachis duranensis]XP_025700394.1 isoflavone-7-O-methyltransferase 9 [Arachis hypogaea]QHO42400.1 Isoflavone 7-O-methyltransferase [Arachis hypogaea]RYR58236.1 hypothetical protein Ahy_A05g023892 [Arachis hypogaea]
MVSKAENVFHGNSNGNSVSIDELFKAQAHLYRVMASYTLPMCVKWAIDLSIPNIIHNRHSHSISLSDLVSALNAPPPKTQYVQRIMRLLTHDGIFAVVVNEESKEEEYVLTPTSELLVKGTDHCVSAMAEYIINPTTVGFYNYLAKWTCDEKGQTTVETALGSSAGYWDFIHENPKELKIFNDGMESDSNVVRFALRDCKSVFEGLDSLVDVGGATGNTAKIICEAFPKLKCRVLDLPHVVAGLPETENLKFFGGSMFDFIPHADAILFKWVLGNWSDDHCIQVLEKCKEAISGKSGGGKVIIIDIVINENEDEHDVMELKLFSDIAAMTLLDGKERDEKDWKKLFLKAGFKNYKVFSIFGFRSLIEVYP